jgi:hypothetical protein
VSGIYTKVSDALWDALVDGIREALEEHRRKARENPKPRAHVRLVYSDKKKAKRA